MSEKKHALLSASGSERWINCPPSALLEQEFQEERSFYAKEGELAHDIAENKISLYLENISKNLYTRRLNRLKKDELYSGDIEKDVQPYVDFAIERINYGNSRDKGTVVLVEHRLDFSNYVPHGFGTGDLVIISDNVIEVVDLKFGKGVPVDAKENTQMMLYAVGALNQFGCLYDIEKVSITIVQPRLDSISTHEIDVNKLITWAENVVRPKAKLAIEGKGDFSAGEHCRFCKGRFNCRARAEENMKMAQYDFKKGPLLTDDEISDIIFSADEFKKWIKDIEAYTLDKAVNENKKWTGFKLVEGRSSRKYRDEEVVANTLLKAGFKECSIYSKNLLGITAMEKIVGKKKFNELLDSLVFKPQGKLTLVSENDKRPEIKSTAEADFK